VGVFAEDPTFSDCDGAFPCSAAWALQIVSSDNIQITGAGLYSWFQDYDEACVDTQNCQQRLTSTTNNGAIYLFNVYTIGSIGMVHDFIETFGTEVSSTLSLALAADNTVENAHPYLAAIVAWVEIFSGW
jgi:glucan 1,3-beta-glucosidase